MSNFGRMAGLLFIVGSAGSIPSSIILARSHESPQELIVLTAVGIISGIACLLLPWERSRPTWHLALVALALVEVFLFTHATGHHYAILYLLIITCGAYVYRPAWLVVGITVAALLTLLAGGLVADDNEHALALSLILASTSIALALTIYTAREHSQRERMRAATITADVLRVSLALEAGHGRVASPVPERHRSQMIALLQSLDDFRGALRGSLLRVDAAPVLDEAWSPKGPSH